MAFVRKFFAGQPLVSSHREPAQMGFRVGWNLAERYMSFSLE